MSQDRTFNVILSCKLWNMDHLRFIFFLFFSFFITFNIDDTKVTSSTLLASSIFSEDVVWGCICA